MYIYMRLYRGCCNPLFLFNCRERRAIVCVDAAAAAAGDGGGGGGGGPAIY